MSHKFALMIATTFVSWIFVAGAAEKTNGPSKSTQTQPPASSATASHNTYRVGPNEKYKSMKNVAALLKPGDIVEIREDIKDSAVFTQSGTKDAPIIIRGIGNTRPKVDFDGAFNGIEVGADHYVIEHLELFGAQKRGIYHSYDDLTVRDCVIRNNANGMMSAMWNHTGDLLVENCELFQNGFNTYTHHLYLTTNPGHTITVRGCWFHGNCGKGAANVKSRAQKTIIEYCWMEEDGEEAVDLCGGHEDTGYEAVIRGCVFIKGVGQRLVCYHAEGGHRDGRLFFLHNTVIAKQALVLWLPEGTDHIISNNIFSLSETELISSDKPYQGECNWLHKDQKGAAGLKNSVVGSDPGLEKDTLFPVKGSPVINAAAKAADKTQILHYNYIKHLKLAPRADDGRPDIGALEYEEAK